MLGIGRYLLGVAEIGILVGFAGLGAARLRSRLLPDFDGAPAHLATIVLALALLLWVAEMLGSAELFKAAPYLAAVVLAGATIWALDERRGGGSSGLRRLLSRRSVSSLRENPLGKAARTSPAARRSPGVDLASVVALTIAAVVVLHFASGVRMRLSTGMTGFDSTWYHGPFAAGFFQTGNTFDLHFIAPQFLAWFYPANSEIFHAIGMMAFGRDLLSPLLNLGWLLGSLVALWCIGRPYRVAPFSLALGAIALSVPALGDQAGEARNDIVGIFFLLAAAAIAVNAWEGSKERRLSLGATAVIALAAGLAAGTKLNLLLPAAVIVVGIAAIQTPGRRWRALSVGTLAALAGGGYWYLRNLFQTGNPLPWVHHLGPISLPAPAQGLGGREAHDVLGYLSNGSIWSHWLLPGLHSGLWIAWPLLVGLALAGLILTLAPLRRLLPSGSGAGDPRRGAGALLVAGAAGLAVALAWLIAPTSAAGPSGSPRGFESGLRYLAPALVLGLALLPTFAPLRAHLLRFTRLGRLPTGPGEHNLKGRGQGWTSRGLGAILAALVLLAVVAGYPIERHYLSNRYANPDFTTPGLNAAFRWAGSVSDSRIATTSTRQYPLFGTDLSNRVQYVGAERPHGGFVAIASCRAWRTALDAGDYDYVVASRDRVEPGKPPYPPQAAWTEGPGAEVVLRTPPTVVFRLTEPPDPSKCR